MARWIRARTLSCKQKPPCRGLLAYFDVHWLQGVEVISFLQTFKSLCLLILLLLLLLLLTWCANILEPADKGNPGNAVFGYTHAPPHPSPSPHKLFHDVKHTPPRTDRAGYYARVIGRRVFTIDLNFNLLSV
jgi:hypothetical protein